MMRIPLWLPVWAGLLGTNLAAGTIQFQVTNLGSNVYEYDYFLTGITISANEELDFQFDHSLYGSLSSPGAPSGYILMLLQPNNPPGTNGVYSVYAPVANLSTSGTFKVDFSYLGPGQPGSQPYVLNQFDLNGNLISSPGSGTTTAISGASVPEPYSFSLVGVGLFLGGAWWAVRRRFGAAA